MHITFAPLSIHDKSANAGTTLFGGFDVDHSKTPHLNQGAEYERSDWLKPFFARHAKQHNRPSSWKCVPDGKDWFGCHLPEPVTGNLTDPKLCGHWSPVAFKKNETVKLCTSNECDK